MRILRLLAVAALLVLALWAWYPLNGENSSFTEQSEKLVSLLKADHISDQSVLDAIKKVPRHLFVSEMFRSAAYENIPLPIGNGQTISQPMVVAVMTQALQLKPEHTVLEIGTGSGYQAAILAEIAKEVFSIEIIPSLGKAAETKLKELGYKNIQVRIGDGYQGWPEKAPFDRIIVTAAPSEIPRPLIDQLKENGRLVIPVGEGFQELILVTKEPGGNIHEEKLLRVRFVPMTGEAQKK